MRIKMSALLSRAAFELKKETMKAENTEKMATEYRWKRLKENKEENKERERERKTDRRTDI